MENWDEIRTAFHVARLGTVSGAAEVLGVHHATVIRHIDALEKRLGVRLFQRHARGYVATEAGRDLLGVAQATEEQFSQLANRIKGQGESVTGELVVTSISELTDLLTPVLTGFQRQHPGVIIRFLTDARLFRLDFGEAHVAIRVGGPPKEPDYVAKLFLTMRIGLYASRSYVEQFGIPKSVEEFSEHRFVGVDGPGARARFNKWLRDTVPEHCMTYLATELTSTDAAVRAGAGIGFLAARLAEADPDLVEVMAPQPDWESPFWLVTHVDLHRTLKVQSFLAHLKKAAEGWVGL